MGLKLGQAKTASNRPQPPEGNHVGICVQILDLGTQQGEWQGKPKLNRKVRITWELPDERAVFDESKGEQPFITSKTYNFSVSEKSTFRKDLESWRGRPFTDQELKDFDIERLLGVGAMVNLVKNENGYFDVATVAALPKSLKASLKEPENKPYYYSIEQGRTDVFHNLPDFLKKMCEECKEWNDGEVDPDGEPSAPVADDDIDF